METDKPPRLLSVREVIARTGFSRSRIYDGMAAGTFPPAVKVGRSARWLESEVSAWIIEHAKAGRYTYRPRGRVAARTGRKVTI